MNHAINTNQQTLTMNSNKGTNQVGIRNYNEKLILQLVRQHGSITKVEATKSTGLSPNAISVIFRSLEKANFLVRGEPIRGRVGQPSIPMSLNPNAAFYLGLKIGRRNSDLILVDFLGKILSQKTITYDYPLPEKCIDFTQSTIKELVNKARISNKQISGLGVAIPHELWSWAKEYDAPEEEMQSWKTVDLKSALSKKRRWDVLIDNDGNAACAAELAFGAYQHKQDFIYFFVGTMIGGGIVLNGSVYKGPTGSAGSFGAMLVPDKEGKLSRLIDQASLFVLDQMIAESGGSQHSITRDEKSWQQHTDIVDKWLNMTARGLAHAILSSLSVIDFPDIVIDGAFPESTRKELVSRVSIQIENLDKQGIRKPKVAAGNCGYMARALGAASLPLSAEFAINQNTLFRS